MLLTPADTAWLRFAIINESDEPVEIPTSSVEGAAPIGLSGGLVFGTDSQPALQISLDSQRLEPVRPAQWPAALDGKITLAPHAILGMAVDLRSIGREVRYSGHFRVEWRPPLPKIAPAAIEFRVEARKKVVFYTDFGNITFLPLYEKAPRNVENFLDLVRDRFYDGKQFHRVVPEFLIQGGSPDGAGGGQRPDGKTVPAELNDAKFDAGTVAMALKYIPASKENDLNSASCQFFITLSRQPELDGKYTIIGHANDDASLRTLDRIAEQATHENGRPVRPIVIFRVVLVDAEDVGPRRLDSGSR
ncbi:MAG: peptidylprolyl isomerase [Planctomycetes bacterium]|nr:peptidylprolyl isomerase [Planctomycetota bacterium]